MACGQLQAPRMPQEKNSLPSKAEDLKSSRREKGAGGSSPLVRWSSSRATRSSSFGDWVLPYFVVLGTDAIAAALSQDLLVCLVECCWDTKFTGFPKLQLHITVTQHKSTRSISTPSSSQQIVASESRAFSLDALSNLVSNRRIARSISFTLLRVTSSLSPSSSSSR